MVYIEGNNANRSIIKVFPNPIARNQQLHINFSQKINSNVTLALRDSRGNLILFKTIHPEEIENQTYVSQLFTGLSQGVYFLQIHSLDFNKVLRQKIIVY